MDKIDYPPSRSKKPPKLKSGYVGEEGVLYGVNGKPRKRQKLFESEHIVEDRWGRKLIMKKWAERRGKAFRCAVPVLTQVEKDEEALRRELIRKVIEPAKDHFLRFVRILKLDFQIKPYHREMAAKLEAVERGEIKRLMLNLPPRHGKSTLSSIYFPAWFLGRHPQAQVILCAYNTQLAAKFGKQVRDIVASPQYQAIFPETKIRKDSQAADCWYTEQGGVFLSAGIGGGITGWGADLFLIDDPLKDPSEAYSQTIKDNIWDWFGGAAYTRLMPGAPMIGTWTRWCEDDLGGRLLDQAAELGEEWDVVRFPAIAEADDPLGRAEGEALWPEKFPIERLNVIKGILGDQFQAMYQQTPFLQEGNIFKKQWWQYYSGEIKFDIIIQSWDTAFKEKERNDYSVCLTFGYKHPNIYMIDRFRKKMDFPELKRMAEVLAQKYRPSAVLIEDCASGQSLIQEMRRESGFSVIAVKADRSKEGRAASVTPLIQGERVYLPEGLGWVSEYVNEMTKFPKGKYDDDVDSTVMALDYLRPKTSTMYDLIKLTETRPRSVAYRSDHGWMAV